MSISPGDKLGAYEIISLVGVGGMGQVYKARDTRLDRIVAIKVLAVHLAGNTAARERFGREARAVSALNHPNICTLHDIGEHDGQDYLVMEFLDGETLADLLKKGPLPLGLTLDYAIQLADALDKTHRADVVHRDYKPGNIIIIKLGPKITDYGLAKFGAAAQGGLDLTALPTAEKPLTEKGAILGTFQYMAPEQLEAKDTDARTDIFAFGAVLYEMLTGRRAFEGKSRASLIGAILKDEPPAISTYQPLTPPAMDRVVRMCLEKDPDERWQSAHDLHKELKWIAEGGSEAGVSEPVVAASTPVWKRALNVGSILLIGAVIAGVAFWGLTRPGPQVVTRFAITIPATNVFGAAIALSADGRDLIYPSTRDGISQLYLRPMDRLEASPIGGTEGGSNPFFSPDGQWLGFSAEGKLKKVSLAGGPTATICDVEGFGASWGPDDTITISNEYSGLMQVRAAGGEPQQITTVDTEQGEQYHFWPDVLPGGKAVLFTVWYGFLEEAQIAVQSLETGERRMLVGGTHPRYSPTGHIVFARENSLWAVPFDADGLDVTGSPTPLLEGVQMNPWGRAIFSLAGDGSLVYLTSVSNEQTLVWVDRKGVVEPLPAPARGYQHPRLSPDGQRVAVGIREGTGNSDIWIYDIARDTSTRLTFTEDNNLPSWTPDGKRVAFASRRSGVLNIFWKAAYGSDEPEQLTKGENNQVHASISSDGNLLAFQRTNLKTNILDLWVLPLTGERDAQPFLQTPFYKAGATFSPDGKWLAYVSGESGQTEVFVMSYPDQSGKWQISNEGGHGPIWARNGRELFYRNGAFYSLPLAASQMMSVDITTEQGFEIGNPRLLFEGSFLNPSWLANYDVSPDGQRFLMLQPNEQQQMQLNVVLNWFEELKRLAPLNSGN